VDFEFSDDQMVLAASVRRLLSDRAGLAAVRAHYGAPAVVDDVWRALAGLGVTGLLAPESAGGAERGLVDLALCLEAMGAALYPGPFTASAVGAVTFLRETGDSLALDWLSDLASGARVGTVALTPDRTEPLRLLGDALHGRAVHVLDGVAADLLLVAVDRTTVVAITPTTPRVRVEPLETVDGSRKFATVSSDGAHGTIVRDCGAALDAARDALHTALVLDGVGVAETALALAVDYATTREQFGRPIGSFQAVQHLCADMLRAVELGRAAAYYAAWACDEADPAERHRAATMARAFAADRFYGVAATAIQVFGGVGFTWEHDAHLFYKRLLTLQHLDGSAADHLAELASIVLPAT
jgi:alkylation response protein AidB-like acyl-CoA dehydrogenase